MTWLSLVFAFLGVACDPGTMPEPIVQQVELTPTVQPSTTPTVEPTVQVENTAVPQSTPTIPQPTPTIPQPTATVSSDSESSPIVISAPNPTSSIPAPPGLIIQDGTGDFWSFSAASQPVKLFSQSEPGLNHFDPAVNRLITVACCDDGELPREIIITDLTDQSSTNLTLDIHSLGFMPTFWWLDESTILTGVFDDPDDEGPNAGHPALIDAKSGMVTILDDQKMTSPPAVTNGRIVYSVTTSPAPIIYQWENGSLINPSSQPFLAAGAVSQDTSLFSPAVADDGKQAWWGKLNSGITPGLMIYDPAQNSVVVPLRIEAPGMGGFPPAAVFNPDGSWLAVNAWAAQTIDGGVYLAAADGSQVVHLGPNTSRPVWLNEDTLAYLVRTSNRPLIQTYTLSTGETAIIELPDFDQIYLLEYSPNIQISIETPELTADPNLTIFSQPDIPFGLNYPATEGSVTTFTGDDGYVRVEYTYIENEIPYTLMIFARPEGSEAPIGPCCLGAGDIFPRDSDQDIIFALEQRLQRQDLIFKEKRKAVLFYNEAGESFLSAHGIEIGFFLSSKAVDYESVDISDRVLERAVTLIETVWVTSADSANK